MRLFFACVPRCCWRWWFEGSGGCPPTGSSSGATAAAGEEVWPPPLPGLGRQGYVSDAEEEEEDEPQSKAEADKWKDEEPERHPLIERTLDYLLDHACIPQGLALFKSLCRHYWEINPQATASYINAYREMWDSEDQNDPEAKP